MATSAIAAPRDAWKQNESNRRRPFPHGDTGHREVRLKDDTSRETSHGHGHYDRRRFGDRCDEEGTVHELSAMQRRNLQRGYRDVTSPSSAAANRKRSRPNMPNQGYKSELSSHSGYHRSVAPEPSNHGSHDYRGHPSSARGSEGNQNDPQGERINRHSNTQERFRDSSSSLRHSPESMCNTVYRRNQGFRRCPDDRDQRNRSSPSHLVGRRTIYSQSENRRRQDLHDQRRSNSPKFNLRFQDYDRKGRDSRDFGGEQHRTTGSSYEQDPSDAVGHRHNDYSRDYSQRGSREDRGRDLSYQPRDEGKRFDDRFRDYTPSLRDGRRQGSFQNSHSTDQRTFPGSAHRNTMRLGAEGHHHHSVTHHPEGRERQDRQPADRYNSQHGYGNHNKSRTEEARSNNNGRTIETVSPGYRRDSRDFAAMEKSYEAQRNGPSKSKIESPRTSDQKVVAVSQIEKTQSGENNGWKRPRDDKQDAGKSTAALERTAKRHCTKSKPDVTLTQATTKSTASEESASAAKTSENSTSKNLSVVSTTARLKASHVVKSATMPAKKTAAGIPMRWLKPVDKPKPKVVHKLPPKTTSTLDSSMTVAKNLKSTSTLNKTEMNLEIPEEKRVAPKSPLLNRVVTDSEGGSTVSNSRDFQLLVTEKKYLKPEVPSAIVTHGTGTIKDAEYSKRDAVKPSDKLRINLNRTFKHDVEDVADESDHEPPLESGNDSSTSSSNKSTSEDSDTDDEEVMMWASKMFGVTLPSGQSAVATTQQDVVGKGEVPVATRKPLKLRLKLSPSKLLNEDSSEIAETSVSGVTNRMKKKAKKVKKALHHAHTGMEKKGKLAVRGRKKLKKSREKSPKLEEREVEVDEEQQRRDREEEKRIREEAKPLTAAQIREILGDDEVQGDSQSNWVRRSVRQPSRALLSSKPLKYLVAGLKGNYPDMKVLKMKKYINDPNAPSVVIDAALEALEENTNCEALYIQNFNEGLRDKQVLHLLRILQSPSCNIWCMNIGENYNVDTETWEKFTQGLRRTKITHMYASEHTITTEMKDEIREIIRNNRKKHDRHINPNNLDVIVQCTHCWWNPINAKSLRPYLTKQGFEYILNDREAQGLRGSTSEAPSA